MKKFLLLLLAVTMVYVPTAFCEEDFVVYKQDFSSQTQDLTLFDGASLTSVQGENTNTALNFADGSYSTAEIINNINLDYPLNIEGKILRKRDEVSDNYWDFRVFLLTDSTPVLTSSFGSAVYLGTGWKNVSVFDYEENEWSKFRIRLEKTNTNVEIELFLDGNSYGKVVENISGNITGIRLGSFLPKNDGTLYVDDIAYVSENSKITSLLEKINNKEDISKEECLNWLEVFSENKDYETAVELYNAVYEYAELKGYIKSGVLESGFPKNNDVVYAGDGNKISYVYSGMLSSNQQPNITLLKNGNENVNFTYVVSLNSLYIYTDLEQDCEYTLNIDNLYTSTGTEIDFETVNFKTSIIPLMNVVEGSTYDYGQKIIWNSKSDISVNVSVKVNENTQSISNGDSINMGGDCVLNINAVKGTESQNYTIGFKVKNNTVPVAKDVKISGTPQIGKKLTGLYTYYDNENDSEVKGETKTGWYISNTKNGEYTLYLEGNTLTVSEDVFSKYVKFGVIPKSNHAPDTGELTFSDVVVMPFVPEASDVYIKGNAVNGGILTGYYTYFDPNSDKESADTLMEWVDSNGKVLGTGASLRLTSSMVGKNVAFRVTVKNKVEPTTGVPVTSSYVTILNPSAISGGGNGGGGMVVGSNSGSVKKDDTVTTPSNPTTPTTPTPEVLPEGVFNDTKNHWAKDYIKELYLKGIVTGIDEKEYEPDSSISRAQFVTMIVRLKGGQLYDYVDSYNDVSKDDWFATYVQTALNDGIITIDENFRPNDNITREEAAKILSYFVKKAEKEVTFNDSEKIADWAKEFVEIVASQGIFEGDENGNFNPQKNMTRAEAATVVSRLLQMIGGEISE